MYFGFCDITPKYNDYTEETNVVVKDLYHNAPPPPPLPKKNDILAKKSRKITKTAKTYMSKDLY